VNNTFDALILTCEHGGNDLPSAYAALFDGEAAVLATHRGWDIGALGLAQAMATQLGTPLYFSTTTRLLVDLNRSLHVKGVWSQWTRPLDAAAKNELIHRYYQPYRTNVEAHLTQLVGEGKRVLHLSIHSFTQVLNGETRNADVGILYDPKRAFEATLARALAVAVQTEDKTLRVRRNYPYVGYTDGFTTYLRRKLAATHYAGVEIETRQDAIATRDGQKRFAEIYRRAIQTASALQIKRVVKAKVAEVSSRK
jgi:predicted N-formylglutamate amidohydrolase